ncbi:uncharacterized protein KY384_006719 [Bacidia gigantensis]|uniref:uncharacterized protein n=1 Tax=Bacidia gigantensis TaxID=2732470 RepID=UPI001D04A902|nr:uncharacterized protein KY384_006719 [Bacidia gigantensis]KAG8529029.1 hypothetical protein KY384_006719 [Bacidia gigantensis]
MAQPLGSSTQPTAATQSQSSSQTSLSRFRAGLDVLGLTWPTSTIATAAQQTPQQVSQPLTPPGNKGSDIIRILVNDAMGTTQTLSDMSLPLNVDRIIDVAPAANAFGPCNVRLVGAKSPSRASQLINAGASSIATITDRFGRSSLLVGCTAGLQFFTCSQATDRTQTGTLLTSDPLFCSPSILRIAQDQDSVVIWSLSGQKTLGYTAVSASAMGSGTPCPVLPSTSFTGFSACVSSPSPQSGPAISQTLIANDTVGNLSLLQQFSDSKLWRSQPFYVAASADVMAVPSYTITISTTTGVANTSTSNGNIIMSASSSNNVICNGSAATLTTAPTAYPLDDAGQLHLIVATDSIAAQTLTLSGLKDAQGKDLSVGTTYVDPSRKIIKALSQFQTGDDLTAALTQKLHPPLAPGDVPDKGLLKDAAAGIQQLILDKIKLGIDKLVQLLGYVFDWNAIMTLKRNMKDIVNSALDYGAQEIMAAQSKVDTFFDMLESRLPQSQTALDPAFSDKLAETGGSPDPSLASGTALNWAGERLKSGSIADNPALDGFDSMYSPIEKGIGGTDDITQMIEDSVSINTAQFEAVFRALAKDVTDLFQSQDAATAIDALKNLGKDLLFDAIEGMRFLAKALLKIVASIVLLIKKIANTTLINEGDAPSILDIVCFLIAVPGSVAYRAANVGNMPPVINANDMTNFAFDPTSIGDTTPAANAPDQGSAQPAANIASAATIVPSAQSSTISTGTQDSAEPVANASFAAILPAAQGSTTSPTAPTSSNAPPSFTFQNPKPYKSSGGSELSKFHINPSDNLALFGSQVAGMPSQVADGAIVAYKFITDIDPKPSALTAVISACMAGTGLIKGGIIAYTAGSALKQTPGSSNPAGDKGATNLKGTANSIPPGKMKYRYIAVAIPTIGAIFSLLKQDFDVAGSRPRWYTAYLTLINGLMGFLCSAIGKGQVDTEAEQGLQAINAVINTINFVFFAFAYDEELKAAAADLPNAGGRGEGGKGKYDPSVASKLGIGAMCMNYVGQDFGTGAFYALKEEEYEVAVPLLAGQMSWNFECTAVEMFRWWVMFKGGCILLLRGLGE